MADRPPKDPLTEVRTRCLELPEVTERASHGEPGWFIRGKKSFAMFALQHHDERIGVWLAAAPGVQADLLARSAQRFYVPPYVGTRGWIGLRLDVPGFDPAELDELIVDAYLTVAPVPLRRLVADQ